MKPFKIFIVEDDVMYSKILSYHLSLNEEYEVTVFNTAREFLDNLHQNPSVVSLDIDLPDMHGVDVYKKIREFDEELPVIIVSGQQDISTAVDLLKLGVYDYIIKDNNTKERMWLIMRNIKSNFELKQNLSNLKEQITEKFEYAKFIKGDSPQMQHVFKMIDKAVKSNITVSIYGETGTGKEMVAKAIHFNSKRAAYPFVAVNVSAIPSELIESEMFGYEKGAFTGAQMQRIGKFEEANHGTLFLDEIANMDLNMQTKLLRALQEEEIVRIGSNKSVKLDVRIIVASNKNLLDEVAKGNIREDLYFRLLGFPIELPPLKYRGSDVQILSRYFIDEFCAKNDMEKLTFSHGAMNKLMNYSYPGNVRELKAIVELAAVLCNSNTIQEEDINLGKSPSHMNFFKDEYTFDDYTLMIIKEYMRKYDNKVKIVSEKLNIGKSTIYRILKDNPDFVNIAE